MVQPLPCGRGSVRLGRKIEWPDDAFIGWPLAYARGSEERWRLRGLWGVRSEDATKVACPDAGERKAVQGFDEVASQWP